MRVLVSLSAAEGAPPRSSLTRLITAILAEQRAARFREPAVVNAKIAVEAGAIVARVKYVRALEEIGVAVKTRERLGELDGAGRLAGRNLDLVRHDLKEVLKNDLYAAVGFRMDDGKPVKLDGMTREEAHARLLKLVRFSDTLEPDKPGGKPRKLRVNSKDFGNLGEHWYRAWYLDGEVHSEVEVPADAVSPALHKKRYLDHLVLADELVEGNTLVEVKSGAESIRRAGVITGDIETLKDSELQFDDHMLLVGKDVKTKSGDMVTIEQVRYVFLDPEGGARNIGWLASKLRDESALSVEILRDGGERIEITHADVDGLSDSQVEAFVRQTRQWLRGESE